MKLKYKTDKNLVLAGSNLPALISHPIAKQEPPILIMPHQSATYPEEVAFDKDLFLTQFASVCFKLATVCLIGSAILSALAPI